MQRFASIINDMVSLLTNMGLRDAIDILMVALIFFLMLSLIRQSRSQVALRGLIIVLFGTVGLYLITIFAELTAMSRLFERLWVVIALVFLIVFQNEFKKALTEFGRMPIFRAFFHQESAVIEEIIKAAVRLSEKKTGALIGLERRTTLRPYIETGTLLDAHVTVELLRTIFTVYTPLHDGAVIIRNNRIVGAGCLLPLSGQDLSKDLGTRHRAAVGLTEETDAVVVVVSEETGTISLAHDGAIHRPETAESLRLNLRALFAIREETGGGEAA
ncbi:TIGR00159 family protein [Candidatus Poribacteria bacterium]|nr:TIGR00159 family protein [Candidatus Poribacteria bacterium]